MRPDGTWAVEPFNNPPPFDHWEDLKQKMKDFFLTTETQDNVTCKISTLKQGSRKVEDYIIKFRSIAMLTGYNRIALVMHFCQGLNLVLGRQVVEIIMLDGARSIDRSQMGDLQ